MLIWFKFQLTDNVSVQEVAVISALTCDFHVFNPLTTLSKSKNSRSVAWMRILIFVRALFCLMKSWQVTGRVLGSFLPFLGPADVGLLGCCSSCCLWRAVWQLVHAGILSVIALIMRNYCMGIIWGEGNHVLETSCLLCFLSRERGLWRDAAFSEAAKEWKCGD